MIKKKELINTICQHININRFNIYKKPFSYCNEYEIEKIM